MSETDSEAIDPITLEVIDNRLDEIVREMQHVMFRTGYSTIVRDSKDGSAGICLPDGRVIGQAFRLPLHCGIFPSTIEGIRQYFSTEEIEEGDAFIVNDPYLSGANHSPDLFVATPVIHDDEIQAFCITVAHKPDIGGLVPGTSSPDAREIYHEGLLLPPVKYRRQGEVNKDIENIIRNNSRTPDVTLGDIRGQAGCTTIGAERIKELLDEYGVDQVNTAAEMVIESTRQNVADAVRSWDGSASVEGFLDDETSGGDPMRIALEVSTTAGEGQLLFDFSGSAPQNDGPTNMRPHVTKSACYYSVAGIIDPTLALNSGVGEACEFELPEGSIVNPNRPAPVNHYSRGIYVLVHMALRALSQFKPDRAVAESGGKMSLAVGQQRSTPEMGDASDETEQEDDVVHYEIIGSGFGGHAEGDGASCMASSYESNPEFTPIEIIETEYDDRVSEFSVDVDSAGPGRSRGGLGFIREYEALAPLKFTYRGSNQKVPSQGVGGGKSSGTARGVYNPGLENEREMAVIDTVNMDTGDKVRIERPGGAGFGNPLERPLEKVLADVKDGFLSPTKAKEEYGVVIRQTDQKFEIAEEETATLRDERRGSDPEPS